MKKKYTIAFALLTLVLPFISLTQAYDKNFHEEDFMMDDDSQSDFFFEDIDDYDWEDSVQYLGDKEIIQGYADGTYKPDQKMNRAEFTKIVIEGFFKEDEFATSANNCFSDVHSTDWFSKYVCFAQAKNIIAGYPDGSFGPEKTVNQAEALKIVLNASFGGFKSEFQEDGGNWYDAFLEEAGSSGMMYFETQNAPAHEVTRGEMAYFMAWMLTDGEIDQIPRDDFDGEYGYSDEDLEEDNYSDEDLEEDDYSDEDLGLESEEDWSEYSSDEDVSIPEDTKNDSANKDKDNMNHNKGDLKDDSNSNAGPIMSEDDAEFKTLGYYDVVGNDIKFLDGVDSKTYQSVWDFFQKIIPADMRKNVVEYEAYDDPDGWLAGSMSKTEATDGVKWGLAVNINMTTKDEKVTDEGLELLVHEFGHVLTLAGDQMDHVDSGNLELVKKVKQECKTFFVPTIEGCIKKDSYLDKFINKFWSDKEYLHRTLTEITFNAREGHQTDFVTGYAASTPVEDIAESFAYFVLKDKPTGSTIAEQKMLFFYDYPDFVRLRNQVQAKAGIQWDRKLNLEN